MKEAMYKMYEKMGIDFAEQLRVENIPFAQKGITTASIISEASCEEVEIYFEQRDNLVWAVCLNE